MGVCANRMQAQDQRTAHSLDAVTTLERLGYAPLLKQLFGLL